MDNFDLRRKFKKGRFLDKLPWHPLAATVFFTKSLISDGLKTNVIRTVSYVNSGVVTGREAMGLLELY